MVGASIRISAKGSAETQAALAAALQGLQKPAPMWDAIGLSLVTSTQRRFEEGRAPDGSPWPPSLRAKLTGGKTLIDSALLMQSITHVASDDGVAVGTNAVHAAVHQFGATIVPVAAGALKFQLPDGRYIMASKVTIPARPFLGLDDDDEREIVATAEEFASGPLTGGANAP